MSNITETLTLTDFLLARIAEDEAEARTLSNYSATFNDGRVPMRVRCDPRRILAECEAKRQIVALAVDGFEHNPNSTLCILATVYADHPDYREEWRA